MADRTQPPSMTELKPCPCCQGEAEGFQSQQDRLFYVRCNDCGLKTGPRFINDDAEQRAAVITSWNTRASLPDGMTDAAWLRSLADLRFNKVRTDIGERLYQIAATLEDATRATPVEQSLTDAISGENPSPDFDTLLEHTRTAIEEALKRVRGLSEHNALLLGQELKDLLAATLDARHRLAMCQKAGEP